MSDGEEDDFPQVGVRLRHALVGHSQSDVAARAGISTRTLQRYLEGANFKLKALVAIADACEVSLDWLVTGRGPSRSEPVDGTVDDANSPPQFVSDTGKPRYVAIPRLNIAASAGGGALAEHTQVVEYLAFDIDFVRNRFRRDPKHLVLIEARGDSMEPAIRDGDILTVDLTPGQPLHNAQLYVLRVGDNLLVKRLEQRLDGGLIVHSDNTRYAPETIAREQLVNLNILGEVLLVSTPPR